MVSAFSFTEMESQKEELVWGKVKSSVWDMVWFWSWQDINVSYMANS